ncbi:hypothetical protein [uncultured Algibacter sp.]|uniref:hypothetical protein n=1 Tax=uncultured Algibacter sp. TaxID=298659 RepID=UPI00261F44D5|nr:hypothetical protein [uncultured Algibacter sp.]
MKKTLVFLAIMLITNIKTTYAFIPKKSNTEINKDSLRIAELNQYWKALSKTVKEGDFEGYAAAYHEDAVVIFATGKNKVSVPLAKALASWKQGFNDTKAGKNKSGVTFRFSQRIGDATTAHETGIFKYYTSDSNNKNNVEIMIHFEMLLVKKNDKWLGVMEYQKNQATLKEWEALKNK